MSEWKKCKLGEIATLHYGKALKTQNRINGDIPVYSSAGLTGYHNEPLVNSEGLIIGRKGTIGKVYYSSSSFFCIDTAYYILPHEEKYNFKYLYYLLQTLGFNELNEDSAVPGLNRETAYSQEIRLPPLPEQKAIASILSSLDDKIDLLHRQNKTLEAMAETLFRQWFVDDEDEGWEEGCLGDVVDLIYGKGLKKEIRIGTEFPVVGSSGIIDYHSEYLVEGPGIVIGRKGTLGKVIYMDDNFYPIDTTYYIKSKINSASLLYEYFLLKTINFAEMNSDSAVPGLNRDIALSTEIKMAPKKTIDIFSEFTSISFGKIKNNTKQIYLLEKLRNTLLPKLISGEVKVKT
jgi:type I restriction enzyme, S subunit